MSSDTNTEKKILIIEDDKSMNDSLHRKFEKMGYETDSCFDGEQGLNMMNKKLYDAITLDLLMPIQDGFFVLAKKTTTLNAKTPTYVLTALEGEKCELAKELGAKNIFIKSHNSPAEIAETIRKDIDL